MKSDDIKKILQSNTLEKYGVLSTTQLLKTKEKIENTCLKKYGVKYPITLTDNLACHSKKSREKAVQTMRERYGGVGFELKPNRDKARETLLNSGNILTSSQQKETYKMIKQLYPNADECVLNKPLSTLALDISLKIKDTQIDIELDGEYWHQNLQKDRRRDEVVKKFGYKILRIRFNHLVIDIEKLKEAIQELLNNDILYKEIKLLDCKNN